MLKQLFILITICNDIYSFSIPTTASVRKITDKYFKIYEPPMTEDRFFFTKSTSMSLLYRW